MSSQFSPHEAIDAVAKSDLPRMKAALDAAERHLREYGDVPTLAELLRVEIKKHEQYRG